MARSGSVVWHGLDEYKQELRRLPQDCLAESAKIVEGGVNSAFVQIASVYGAHRVTGDLRKGLKIAPLKVRKQMTTGLVLTSNSQLAWLFDHGSQARHYYHRMTGDDWKTRSKGTLHSTGAMWGKTPPTFIFKRTVGQSKRKIGRQLRDMLRRRGAKAITEMP